MIRNTCQRLRAMGVFTDISRKNMPILFDKISTVCLDGIPIPLAGEDAPPAYFLET